MSIETDGTILLDETEPRSKKEQLQDDLEKWEWFRRKDIGLMCRAVFYFFLIGFFLFGLIYTSVCFWPMVNTPFNIVLFSVLCLLTLVLFVFLLVDVWLFFSGLFGLQLVKKAIQGIKTQIDACPEP